MLLQTFEKYHYVKVFKYFNAQVINIIIILAVS